MTALSSTIETGVWCITIVTLEKIFEVCKQEKTGRTIQTLMEMQPASATWALLLEDLQDLINNVIAAAAVGMVCWQHRRVTA